MTNRKAGHVQFHTTMPVALRDRIFTIIRMRRGRVKGVLFIENNEAWRLWLEKYENMPAPERPKEHKRPKSTSEFVKNELLPKLRKKIPGPTILPHTVLDPEIILLVRETNPAFQGDKRTLYRYRQELAKLGYIDKARPHWIQDKTGFKRAGWIVSAPPTT